MQKRQKRLLRCAARFLTQNYRNLPLRRLGDVDRDMTKKKGASQHATVTIVMVSDTHELHRELDVPQGDLLIHAGDFTMFSRSAAAILDFNDWLGELPHRFKVVVPGNHEFFLVSDRSKQSLISNATLLINENVEMLGLTIWGSPVTSAVGGAFAMPSERARRELYSKIPEDTDIVITHGPPFGILDQHSATDSHAGCVALRDVIGRVKPRLHVFGHIHGGHGMTSNEDTVFVNAAVLGPEGDLNWPATSIRMTRT
jgi:Icc-related predicted phosphoesterase